MMVCSFGSSLDAFVMGLTIGIVGLGALVMLGVRFR